MAHRDRWGASVLLYAQDGGIRPAVLEKVFDAVAQWTVDVESAKSALEVREAEDPDRLVHGAARGIPDKRCDRGGDARHCVDPAGNLFDVNAWVRRCHGHVASPR